MPSIDLVGGLDQAAVTVNLSLPMDISVLFLVICCIVDLVGHPRSWTSAARPRHH